MAVFLAYFVQTVPWYNVKYRDLQGPNIGTGDHAGKPQITGMDYYIGIP